MEIVDKDSFFEIQSKMDWISPHQCLGWLNYQERNDTSFCYFVDNIEKTTICSWGRLIKKKYVGKFLRIYGESYKCNILKDDIRKFYTSISELASKSNIVFIDIQTDSLYNIDYELGIRQAGFMRPMTLSLCPLTIIVELDKERESSRLWRRQLKKAQEQDILFEYIDKPTEEHIHQLCSIYGEMVRTKHLRNNLNESAISILLNDPSFYLFFVYSENGEPLAARIIYVRQDFSGDVIAANSDKARVIKGTTYFLMENIYSWLRERMVRKFDFGRIGPSLGTSNHVYEFKKYSGGKEVQYNGEWIRFFKKSWIEYLIAWKAHERW